MSPNVLLPELLGGAGPAAISVLAVGAVGMGIVDSIQNITDEEGPESDAAEGTTDGTSDGLEDDGEPIGDGGDLDALAEDDSALDMEEDGDEMGDLAGMGGDGSTAELENRVDTVEGELERLSSTMSTVRSENEEISDAVDEVQENVRQLLEIYEMVTRGVNPFVDEAPDGAFAGQDAASGSIGVFDDEGEEDELAEEDLDEEVVDADAEAFFDDAIEDEVAATDDEEADANEGSNASAPLASDTADGTDTVAEPTDDDDSKSFEELKDEYDDSDESDLTDPAADDATESTADDGTDADSEPADPTQTDQKAETSDPETGRGAHTTSTDDGPYLETMPTGYAGDLVTLEWLTDLVAEAGPQETRQALSYYASVGWISDTVERDLRAIVDGIADTEAAQREGDGTIGVDDHRRSIATIDRLAGSSNQLQHGE